MNQSFPPNQRIRGRKNFQRLFKKGKFERSSYFNFWAFRDNEAEGEKPKLGIVITRKIAPLAVKRNLWRRRIREVFRQNQHRIKPGISLLIQVSTVQKAASCEAIRIELDQLLARTNSLKGTP